jgi:hypothetical protein
MFIDLYGQYLVFLENSCFLSFGFKSMNSYELSYES